MTDHIAAAQAANTNQLSDEYVNAVIQRHGYDSPEAVIARLWQWIGLNGGENSVTLLMYEAHKALSKLRAPVADESPMAKMADALREKARQEQQTYQDRRAQATEWGPLPEGTEADLLTRNAPVAHVAGDETSRYLDWAKDRSAWEMPVGTPVYYSALASAPVADIRIGVSATGQGATVCVMQQHADGTATVIYSEPHPLGDSVGRAALARGPK